MSGCVESLTLCPGHHFDRRAQNLLPVALFADVAPAAGVVLIAAAILDHRLEAAQPVFLVPFDGVDVPVLPHMKSFSSVLPQSAANRGFSSSSTH